MKNFKGKKSVVRWQKPPLRGRKAGEHKIFLYSNTILEPAISLYTNPGFREVPVDGPYKRTNIKMELNIT